MLSNKERKYIDVLIENSKPFTGVTFSILISWQRNRFFNDLEHFVSKWNQLHTYFEKTGTIKNTNDFDRLHYENYKFNLFSFILLLLFLPITIIILFLQWNYLLRVKRKIKKGVTVLEKIKSS